VIADEQLVANVTSLLSVKCKPSRNSHGAYVVTLDDEYLIVHRVIQRTLIAYAYGAVFADLRKVPVLSRALPVTWYVLMSAVSMREVLGRVLLSS